MQESTEQEWNQSILFEFDDERHNNEAWAMTVDNLPSLEDTWLLSDDYARTLIESKMQLLRDGEFDQVELPTDAVGAYRRVVELEKTGSDRRLVTQARRAARFDAQMGLGEALSKLTWDIPPARTLEYDASQKTLRDHGFDLRDVYARALTPTAPSEELERRVAEFNNLNVIAAMPESGLAEDYIAIEISMCPDDPDTYKSAYVKDIEKLAIRTTRFEQLPDGGWAAVVESVYMNGTRADVSIMNKLRSQLGIEGQVADKTDMLASLMLVHKDIASEPIDIAVMLDDLLGPNVFMGEEVSVGTDKDYDQLKVIAAQRYQEIEQATNELDKYSYELAQRAIPLIPAEQKLERKRKELAYELCKDDPVKAAQCFDEATAAGIQRAMDYEQAGDYSSAAREREETYEQAPDVVVCGAGACGLERLSLADKIAAESMGLRSLTKQQSDEAFLHLKGSKCECGSSRTVIGLSQKGCLDCKTVVDTGFMAKVFSGVQQKKSKDGKIAA